MLILLQLVNFERNKAVSIDHEKKLMITDGHSGSSQPCQIFDIRIIWFNIIKDSRTIFRYSINYNVFSCICFK